MWWLSGIGRREKGAEETTGHIVSAKTNELYMPVIQPLALCCMVMYCKLKNASSYITGEVGVLSDVMACEPPRLLKETLHPCSDIGNISNLDVDVIVSLVSLVFSHLPLAGHKNIS